MVNEKKSRTQIKLKQELFQKKEGNIAATLFSI